MSTTTRRDAVALVVSGTYSVCGIYAPKDLSYIHALNGNSIRNAQALLNRKGWKIIDPNGQYAHPVHLASSWYFYDKHFFIPEIVIVVPISGKYIIQSKANQRFLDRNNLFMELCNTAENIRLFDSIAATRAIIASLDLIEEF